MSTVSVPASSRVTRPWSQTHRGGTVDDRTFHEVTANLPARIQDIGLEIPSDLSAASEEAIHQISRLDARYSHTLIPLAYLLLRSESIASSKIEAEEASVDDFIRAVHGSKANSSATAMAAATGALEFLASGAIDSRSISRAHRMLMKDDPTEAHLAGRFRDMQNWIGGSDHSPRGALYVPPPPESVAELIDDLLAFSRRPDLPVIAQAAIAHSQFEAIHPFTDGNGRIGRALAAGIIRRRGVTTTVTIPVAAALAEVRGRYFESLTSYHDGDAGPIIALWSYASIIATEESSITAQRLAELPEQWSDRIGRPRENSAKAAIVHYLSSTPVFTTEDVEDALGLSSTSASRAIAAATEAGIVRGMTKRTRNQVWGATEVLIELEDLNLRIGTRSRVEL